MSGKGNRKSGKQTGSHKNCLHFGKMMEKHGNVLIYLNPIALRMAKTLLSFGRSECNRVKLTLVQRFSLTLLMYNIVI